MTFGARIRGDLVFGCCLVPRHHWRFWQEIVASWHDMESVKAILHKMTNGGLILIVLCQAVSVLGHKMAVWKWVEQNRQWWLDCCSGQQLSPATSRRYGSNFTPVSSVQCSPASLWSHKFWQIHNFSQWLGVSCDGVTWSFVRSLGCRIISVITQQRSKSANPPTHRAAGPHNYTARAIGELISCSKTQKWL